MDVLATIRSDRAVAVIRGERVADAAGLAETLADAGIRTKRRNYAANPQPR